MDVQPLLDRSHPLGGLRLRLRLARGSDAAALSRLLERRGLEAGPLEIARLTRFDPRRRAVACGTALIGTAEAMLGVGAIDLEPDADPDTVIVDDQAPEGLAELLTGALLARAAASGRRRAA